MTPPRRGSRRHRMHRVLGDERGAAAVELVLLVPLLVLVLLLVVTVGRFASARGLVDDAAHQAARAASLARNPATAEQAARETARTALSGAGVNCTTVNVTVDTTAFAPGGNVRVSVACTVALDEMGALGLPGHRTMTGRATSTVDHHRGAA